MASIAQSNRYKLRGFSPLAHRAPRMALWTNRCTRALPLNQALSLNQALALNQKAFCLAAAAVCLMEQNRTSSPWLGHVKTT
jgi:hypothetical protein